MGRQKLYDKDEKLKQAMRIFWERGYHNVSLNELIKELGLGKRSFYEEFGSKDELYFQALKTYAGMGRDTMSEFFRTGKNLDNLISAIKAILDMTAYDKDVNSCMMSNTSLELGNINEKYRNLVSYHMERTGQEFASVLEEAQKNGEVLEELNIKNLATLINLIFSGSGISARGGVKIEEIKKSIDLFFDLIRV